MPRRRLRSVPVRPATASARLERLRLRRPRACAASRLDDLLRADPVARARARSRRRPPAGRRRARPSSGARPPAPAAVVPPEPYEAPRSLSSTSAAKLSDGTLIARTSCGHRHRAHRGERQAVRRRLARSPVLPATRTPAARSARTNLRAAASAGPPGRLREAAADGERAEHAAHVGVVGPAGARAAAQRVEVRLVAEDRPADPPHAGVAHLAPRGALIAARVERRVAAADEVEVAAQPALRADLAVAHHGRREPRLRPEAPQRGRRREELLDRGGDPRGARVALVERAAGGQVERQRAGAGRARARRRRGRATRAGRCRRPRGPPERAQGRAPTRQGRWS